MDPTYWRNKKSLTMVGNIAWGVFGGMLVALRLLTLVGKCGYYGNQKSFIQLISPVVR